MGSGKKGCEQILSDESPVHAAALGCPAQRSSAAFSDDDSLLSLAMPAFEFIFYADMI